MELANVTTICDFACLHNDDFINWFCSPPALSACLLWFRLASLLLFVLAVLLLSIASIPLNPVFVFRCLVMVCGLG